MVIATNDNDRNLLVKTKWRRLHKMSFKYGF
jgi:hypothetical protein